MATSNPTGSTRITDAMYQRQLLMDRYNDPRTPYSQKEQILRDIRSWENTIKSAQTQIQDEAKAQAQDTRNKVVDLYNQVGTVYSGLVNAGRNEEAAQLRDAAERLARSGSQVGVSSEARQSALNDLAGKLRVAGQKAESEIQAQGINQTLDILKTLAGMDQQAMQNEFTTADTFTTSSYAPARSPATSSTAIRTPAAPRLTAKEKNAMRPSITPANPTIAAYKQAWADKFAGANKKSPVGSGISGLGSTLNDFNTPAKPYMWGEPLVPQSPAQGNFSGGGSDNPKEQRVGSASQTQSPAVASPAKQSFVGPAANIPNIGTMATVRALNPAFPAYGTSFAPTPAVAPAAKPTAMAGVRTPAAPFTSAVAAKTPLSVQLKQLMGLA